ncbi:uncharacterized protein LOC111518981 [Drosophila willistoni]|uniref:uncharacterized protein LOC111518981 n=1 Tax=Drosophila willistoni TaxID=7260 RepID=UPI000C26C434|nr:uncharacterized protein LOC111518981 [Drosophila willistoni]
MEHHNLHWQDLNRRERMDYLLKTGHMSDCSFVVFGEMGERITFRCHKFVLMTVSPVFERMFQGAFREATASENIVLDDVLATDFMAFIQCIYPQEDDPLDGYPLQILRALIYLSKRFLVTYMEKNCLKNLLKRLSYDLDPNEVVSLYEYALQIDEMEILKCVKEKIMADPHKYVNSQATYQLSWNTFFKFINELFTVVKEKTRFDIIERYCKELGFDQCPVTRPKVLNGLQLPETHKIDPINLNAFDFSKYYQLTPMQLLAIQWKASSAIEVDNQLMQVSEKELEKIYQDLEELRRDWKSKQEFAEKLLNSVKYTTMSSYDFCVGPGSSYLLSCEKKFDFLSQICVAEHKIRALRLSSNPFAFCVL